MANRKTLTINGVNFTLLTGKSGEAIARDYEYAERRGLTYLHEVYGTYSWRKRQAYDECDEIRRKVGGYTMYISGANSCFFSLVYLLRYEGKEYVVKETHQSRLIAEVNFGMFR